MVKVFLDIMAYVCFLNNVSGKDPSLRKLLRVVATVCMDSNIYVVANHVPVDVNVSPNLFSRGRESDFFPILR